ncbi:hypothetical protein AgCh_016565 [Apium graveolens]
MLNKYPTDDQQSYPTDDQQATRWITSMYLTDDQFKYLLTVTTQSHALGVCKKECASLSSRKLRTKKHYHFYASYEDFQRCWNRVMKQHGVRLDRSTVNVTFWDKFAKELEEKLEEELEEPIIMIIASAKINLYKGRVEIGHVACTRLNNGFFSEHEFSSQKSEVVKQFNLLKISNLGPEYIKASIPYDV